MPLPCPCGSRRCGRYESTTAEPGERGLRLAQLMVAGAEDGRVRVSSGPPPAVRLQSREALPCGLVSGLWRLLFQAVWASSAQNKAHIVHHIRMMKRSEKKEICTECSGYIITEK